jgi:ribonuclease HI
MMKQNGAASAGVILRTSDGMIFLTACRVLYQCGSALEAELRALIEGISLAREWCQLPIFIETDSSDVLRTVTSTRKDLSVLGNITVEAKTLLSGDGIAGISKIPRSQNIASHELAKFSRSKNCTEVWFGSGPECLLDTLLRDCNDSII